MHTIYITGRFDNAKSDTNYLKVNGFSVALGKQLKWPDDYFSLVYTLNFTQYKTRNYPIFQGVERWYVEQLQLEDRSAAFFCI